MNGIPGATFFTFGAPATAASVTKWDRLFAALMASCLLHLAMVLAPMLGVGGGTTTSSPRAGQKARPPSVLEVRLEEARPPAPASPAASASRAAMDEARGAARKASRGVDVLPFPARLFRTADELTQHPRPRAKPVFNIPAPIFTPGKVILRVWIDALGNVVAVDVEESSVPEALAASAASAFRQTPFAPGEINGGRVATQMLIEVTYVDGVPSYGMKNATR